jgi:membrane glycosyltransferase
VLLRANQLAAAAEASILCPLLELRHDTGLLESHLANLPSADKRIRGQVNPHLAIARAKIDDAESLAEARRFLNPRETFAALNSPTLLRAVLDLPAGDNESASPLKPAS